LEKNGERLTPLPQLKKEMYDKANVDFHIYTMEKFLEHANPSIDKDTISEVRRIRELEERRMMARRMEREIDPRISERYLMEYMHHFEILNEVIQRAIHEDIHPKHKMELDHLLRRITEIRNRIMHGEMDRMSFIKFRRYTEEILFHFKEILHTEEGDPELLMRIKEMFDRLEHLNNKIMRLI